MCPNLYKSIIRILHCSSKRTGDVLCSCEQGTCFKAREIVDLITAVLYEILYHLMVEPSNFFYRKYNWGKYLALSDRISSFPTHRRHCKHLTTWKPLPSIRGQIPFHLFGSDKLRFPYHWSRRSEPIMWPRRSTDITLLDIVTLGVYEKRCLRMEHVSFASSVGKNLCCFTNSLCGGGLSYLGRHRIQLGCLQGPRCAQAGTSCRCR
jgi:hypothetical protein